MVVAWVFLILAVVTEVAGTLTMNASGQSGNLWMYALMCIFISASYTFLSFALKKIAVGVAIAIWEGLGVTLISLISFFLLDQSLSMQKIAGLVLAVTGIILLNFGEVKEAQDEQ
ncbi:putative multidrug transmembrane resistance signal peptide protein [Bdellovibrio bacteriovorus W]|nr:putative multidrug transmembrane resistance signal peptide protein [Bdellovibrio bacteriovorus W]